MKVICIDSIQSDGRIVKLTPGKTYDVYKENGVYLKDCNSWVVKNDFGIARWYHEDVLMSLDKWRDKKLKELGI